MGRCKWKPNWKKDYQWAFPVAGKPYRVFFNSCDSDFSCDRGTNELNRHQTNSKHINNDSRKLSAAEKGLRSISISESLKKAENKNVEVRKTKDLALKAEAKLSNLIATHNIPASVVNCLAELLPKIITDSDIVKQMSLHSTKAFYTLIYGTAPDLKNKLVRQLQLWPFTLNYDESVKGKASQLELNVSYRASDDRIRRSHLVTINMEVGLTGENISRAIFQAMDELAIPYKEKMVSERTDGCATMLGIYKGCHVNNQKIVPQLPDLGGCSCHDACNCLKSGMKALNPKLPSLWKALFPCLEKASIKKSLAFKETCEELGLVRKHAPKYLEVRFRYTMLLAKFFEENEQVLFTYFSGIAARYQATSTLPSENETTIIEVYLGDYIPTRLAHMFLLEVGEPFIAFINFFESRMVRAHVLFPKMALLLNQLFTMFLKPEGRDKLTARGLIKLDYKDKKTQLSREHIFLGEKTRSFIKKIGMKADSPELQEFFAGVTAFYHETSEKLVKYFKTPLNSRFLAALTVIDPMNRQHMNIVEQRENWRRLGEQLNHIVTSDELVKLLMVELPDFQMLQAVEDEGVEVDLWWAQVSEVKLGGESQFPILSRFALALCTICNSSSEVERDFSDMEAIYADSRASSTGQKLLEAKMTVKSAVKQEADNCARCTADKEERKKKGLAGERLSRQQCQHCHCNFLEVDDDLLADLRNSGPHKRSELSVKKAAAENKTKEINSEEIRKKSKEDFDIKLKKETMLFKKRFITNKEEAEEKKKQRAEEKKKAGEKKKKPGKRVAVEKLDTERKKKKLSFLKNDREGNLIQ